MDKLIHGMQTPLGKATDYTMTETKPMAKKIQIEVTTAALKKIEKQGIRFKVVQDDLELRALLFPCGGSVDELDDYEKEQIFDCAIEAIEQGDGYGIEIETLSGRDMNDERCYVLDSVKIVPAGAADITVKQMKRVI